MFRESRVIADPTLIKTGRYRRETPSVRPAFTETERKRERDSLPATETETSSIDRASFGRDPGCRSAAERNRARLNGVFLVIINSLASRSARESTNSDSGTRRARINGNGLGRLNGCGTTGNGLLVLPSGSPQPPAATPGVSSEQVVRYRKDSRDVARAIEAPRRFSRTSISRDSKNAKPKARLLQGYR